MRRLPIVPFALLFGMAVAAQAGMPDFAAVEEIVAQQLSSEKDYQRGDLIWRSRVEPIFTALSEAGWQVADQKEIVEELLDDGDFLVRQFQSKQGKKMFRKVATYAEGYDRLDHLRKLDRGEATVQALIKGPDGYKLLEYMTQSSGGKELGKMLSRVPHGKDFNKPTQRIYTQEQLLARLRKSHAQATQ